MQDLAVRHVPQGPGDAERRVVVVPGRRDRPDRAELAEGEGEYGVAHLLAVPLATDVSGQQGEAVDRTQGREVVALERLEPDRFTVEDDEERDRPRLRPPRPQRAPVDLVEVRAAAGPGVA